MTTEREQVARCAIYEKRPQVCRDYPKVDHYIPPECTFTFVGDQREGECACDVGACCAIPREKGEPGGAPMPNVAGGLPCKHLVWVDGKEKTAGVDCPACGTECPIYDMVGGDGADS